MPLRICWGLEIPYSLGTKTFSGFCEVHKTCLGSKEKLNSETWRSEKLLYIIIIQSKEPLIRRMSFWYISKLMTLLKKQKYNHSKSKYKTFTDHCFTEENRVKIRFRNIFDQRAQIDALTKLKLSVWIHPTTIRHIILHFFLVYVW